VSSKEFKVYTKNPKISHTTGKLSIFEKYDMIKKKNEKLTSNTYAQLWKKTSTTQHSLLSSFDKENGRMYMAFL